MDVLQATIDSIHEHGGEDKAWMEQFEKRQNLTALDRNIVVSLIERIMVYPNHRIEVTYRWQGEFAWQMDILRRVQENEAV